MVWSNLFTTNLIMKQILDDRIMLRIPIFNMEFYK